MTDTLTDLRWSPQQEAALFKIEDWLAQPPAQTQQVFRLFGHAGTGKSTLAKVIREMLSGTVLSGAYTGKAASVMARKGLAGASTIHSMIYAPAGDGKQRVRELEAELRLLERVEEKSLGLQKRWIAVKRALDEARQSSGPTFVLKEESELSWAQLLILDEVSQIDTRMAEDLLSFGVRILVMGDPAQLPPVRGAGYFMDVQPDVLLTEVHRQALDSPVLQIATLARQGKTIPHGEYGTSRVVRKVTAEEAVGHSQVLVGTNRLRRAVNARHRELAGHTSIFPEAGEKLMCLKNDRSVGLLNGTQWIATEDTPVPDGDLCYLRIRPEEGGLEMGVPAEASLFIDEEKGADWRSRGQQFTYGAACTTHKAQGSEWESVLGFGYDWNREHYNNWLYTLCTRASDRLTLVLP